MRWFKLHLLCIAFSAIGYIEHSVMGIQGLIPFLKKSTREANIKEFKGGVVAIDSYCWLHKGAFACAEKLALGEKTDQWVFHFIECLVFQVRILTIFFSNHCRYVYYCMKYVNSLLSFDIKPVMVFDGCRLPSKKEVEQTRRELDHLKYF